VGDGVFLFRQLRDEREVPGQFQCRLQRGGVQPTEPVVRQAGDREPHPGGRVRVVEQASADPGLQWDFQGLSRTGGQGFTGQGHGGNSAMRK
jgi:hypothetical protein